MLLTVALLVAHGALVIYLTAAGLSVPSLPAYQVRNSRPKLLLLL